MSLLCSTFLGGNLLFHLQHGVLASIISIILSVQFSCSVVSDSLRPRGLQRTRLPSPSPTPGACSNSCPLRSFGSTNFPRYLWVASCFRHFLSHLSSSPPRVEVVVGSGNHKMLGSKLTPGCVRVVRLVMEWCYHFFILTFIWLPGSYSRYQVASSKGVRVLATCRACIYFIVLWFCKLRLLKMGEHLYPIFLGMYNWVLLYSSFQTGFSG